MPVPAILAGIKIALPLLTSALDVFRAFKGDAAAAQADSKVQDAVGIFGAVAPLVEGFFARGEPVTPDQVRASLAGFTAALAAADAEILKQSAGDPDDPDDPTGI